MRRRGGRGVPRRDGARKPVNPAASILGALYWGDFDSRDGGIVLNSGNVSSWPNRGLGGGAAIQGTAANQPAFGAASFFGAPGVTGDGVNDSLLCTFATAIPTSRRPTVFCVGNLVAAVLNAVPFALFADDIGTSPAITLQEQAATFGTQRFDSGGSQNPNAGTVALGTARHTFEIGFSAVANDTNIIDGAQATTTGTLTGTNNGALTIARLFSTWGNNNSANFQIRRLIIASDEPSAAQKTALRAYLAGLT